MIICAAMRLNAFDEYPDTIVPCRRHCDGFIILRNLMQNTRYKGHVDEGFINHNGKFLTRQEAYREAYNCGQISVSLWDHKIRRSEVDSSSLSDPTGALYSEDLY